MVKTLFRHMSSVYGFNDGYSLSAIGLNEIPMIRQPDLRNPNILSLNGPSISVPQIQKQLMDSKSVSGGVGVGQHNLSLNFADSLTTAQKSQCRNLTSTENARSAGAAQCIDKQGFCSPPINMRCPAGTVAINQFTNSVSSQPSNMSFSIISK